LSSDLVNEPRDIEDDLFLEYLIICIRNDVISYQVHVSKQFNVTYDSLLRELIILKNCDIPDFDLIRQLEHRLNSLADQKMKNEIEKHRLFEHLNNEKITPYFVKLAKCNKKEAKLSDIVDDQNVAFSSESEQKKYIVDFYSSL